MPVGFDTVNMGDPRQHLAWAMSSMPSHNGGQPIAIPPKAIPEWSKMLYALGFRHHPDEQTLFPVASEQPGMGWLSPVQWVSREEYDKHEANRAAKAEGLDLNNVLAAVNPDLAQRLADMSDLQKRDAMAAEAARLGNLVGRMQEIRKANAEPNDA